MTIAIDSTKTDTWRIDAAHSTVGFDVRHLMIAKVRGRFTGVEGAIVLDESDITASSVEVTVDVASIDTGNDDRDTHLRSADFFDVEKWPALSFRSRRVESGEGGLTVVGDLTIRDVTREVVLEVEDLGRARDPWGGDRAVFTGRTLLDRRDFGLTWNAALESGGVLVGNDVNVSLEVQAVRQSTD